MTAPAPGDPPPDEAADALTQAAFTVTALLSQVAAAHELSLTQLRMLVILRDHQPRIADLAAHLGLERSSVSGLAERAAQRGLIARRTSGQDARAVHLSLTGDGEKLAADITAEIAALLAPMTGRLATTDRTRLTVLLRKLLG
jgi:DNA-binding MarR family transcriptional regulator